MIVASFLKELFIAYNMVAGFLMFCSRVPWPRRLTWEQRDGSVSFYKGLGDF
jgi:hypothetical protein